MMGQWSVCDWRHCKPIQDKIVSFSVTFNDVQISCLVYVWMTEWSRALTVKGLRNVSGCARRGSYSSQRLNWVQIERVFLRGRKLRSCRSEPEVFTKKTLNSATRNTTKTGRPPSCCDLSTQCSQFWIITKSPPTGTGDPRGFDFSHQNITTQFFRAIHLKSRARNT